MEALDAAKKAFEDSAAAVDGGIRIASKAAADGAASAVALYAELCGKATPVVEQGRAYVDQAFQQYRELEDVAFSTATGGIHWAAANPYIAYPAAGLGSMLLLPFTRRMLYRQTLGRLSSPQAVARSCEGRVKGIGAKMEDWSSQVDKLQARMLKAEAEYKTGLANLKATRHEMQRLSGALSKGERSASGLLKELRTLSPKVENVLQIRGEAAGHSATLKSQRVKVDKWVRRIANMDI